jgi:hypothetical protein
MNLILKPSLLKNKQMGHIGEKGIQPMHNKGMVEGFLDCNLEVDFCEHCIYGKQNWVRFTSTLTRGKWDSRIDSS